MKKILQNFISIGNTGNICYLYDSLKDFFQESNLLQKKIQDLKAKKIKTLVIAPNQSTKNQFGTLKETLLTKNIGLVTYSSDLNLKQQVEFVESLLDSQSTGNIAIVSDEISQEILGLTIKLVLFVQPGLNIEEVFSYFYDEKLDDTLSNQLQEYISFLENDPYLITKPDRNEFKRTEVKPPLSANGIKKELPLEEVTTSSVLNLNLNSLKSSPLEDEKLLTETQKIQFNLNSLVESDFEKEESPEEHYEKIKHTQQMTGVEENLSLDVDLSEEIEYISSLEKLSVPTKDKLKSVEENNFPIDETFESTKDPSPTIDYKTKKYIDFDALIEDELEQGMLSEELGLDLGNSNFSGEMNFDDIIEDKNGNTFAIETDDIFDTKTDSAINLDTVVTKANIDLSFPPPVPDLEDLLEEDMELERETGSTENLVDPSHTFIAKRINDAIKNEVLNEDSKGKIPVSDLVKVDTSPEQPSVSELKDPTSPQISKPKISSPKFNPIALDD